MITATQVRAIAKTLGASPRADLVKAIVDGWPAAEMRAGLTTSKRAAGFLANIMTETGGLTILSESGAYRWQTILKIFGEKSISVQYGGRGHSARVGVAEAKSIAALPVAQRGPVLFDRVYGVGNPTKAREFGHTKPGQGWLYRGGGMMQTTGLANYRDKARKTGLPLVEHPEMLHQPGPAFMTAYLEWAQGGCNAAMDRGDITGARKIINGGTNGLSECKRYYASALKVLADYSASAVAPATFIPGDLDSTEAEMQAAIDAHPDDPVEQPDDAPPNVQPVGRKQPDLVLLDVQTRLKARRYPPGVLDGLWGSGTSGALSGFMNDRGLRLHLPSNIAEFHEIADEVQAELLEAEQENWFRPVSEARAAAKPEIVKELAPETVPVKRNWLVALWGSIAAFFSAIWDTVSGYVSQAWDFFTDHKDVVDDHPGIMATVWDHVASVPTPVWLALVGAGLAFIAYNSLQAIKTSTRAVINGERQ